MTFLGPVRRMVGRHPWRVLVAATLLQLAAACPEIGLPSGGGTTTVTAPTNLTATAASATQINLAWSDNSSNEDGFRVERAPGGTTTFAEIATVAAGVTTYQNIGLTGTTQYAYRVRAYNATAASDYSAAATTTTLLASPTAPSNLLASGVSSSQVDITWSDNSNNEDGFRIEQSTTGTTGFAEIATVGPGVTAYQNSGLNPSTGYTYRVRSYNAAGNSGYSNSAAGFTTATPVTPPAAPSGLTATAASTSTINLGWTDNSGDETGFKVERAPGGTTTFVEIATVNAGVQAYQSAGLSPSTAYVYRVRAYNSAGNSAYTTNAGATTLGGTSPPAAPSGLGAVAASSAQINLTWTDNSADEDGFKVERAPGGTATFAEIATVAAGVTTYQNTALPASTQYTYRVRAYNGAGNSSYSATATATTNPSAGTPPAAPSGLGATAASSSQISLAWTDNSADEDGFKVERAPGTTASFVEIATVGAGVTTYQNTALPASTQYTYRVRAYNLAGDSPYSGTATASTNAALSPPSAPTNLQTVPINASEIDLTWNDNSANEDGFKIEVAPDGVTFAEVAIVGAGVVIYAHTGLAPSTTYTYRVRAYNAGGNSAYTNTAGGTTTPNPPSAPTGLGATPVSSSQINLAWTDNASNETGFQVDRAPGGTTSFTLLALVGPGVTAYQNTGLPASTQYVYRVRAYNLGGYSGSSNEVTASTLVAPPAAPSGLSATAQSDVGIGLSWTDNSSNEDGFTIEQAPGGTSTFTFLANVPAGTTTANNNSLPSGTSYTYRVKAYNAGGSSAYSNSATATTWAVVYASAANAMQVQFVNGVQDATYSNTVYSAGVIGVGCNVVIGATSVAGCTESALQFSGFGAAVSGKTISAAYLRLYPSSLGSSFNSVYGAYLFGGPWSPSTITYNTEPVYYFTPEALHAPPNSGTPVDFNVSAHVQAWVAGTPNNGFLVFPTSTPGGSVVETTFFWSDDTYNGIPAYRPQLIIIFQ